MQHQITTIRLDREALQQLKVLTAETNVSRSGLVRYLIACAYREHVSGQQITPGQPVQMELVGEVANA